MTYDLPYSCGPVQAEASMMNTDDPPEQFSLMTRAEPPLALPPMNARPPAHQYRQAAGDGRGLVAAYVARRG
jgi:hypothetical protein